ncbi:MAG: thiamine pyrophosphate-binding protein [Thermoplasmataceae archaeon]
MKGWESFSKSLLSLELDPVFGNPGSTELPMLRGVDKYVLTLLDSLAVGMADGYAQVTGKAAVVNLHTLPGVANSMAFIHTARLNRTPIVITAGQQDTRHAYMEPLLYHDLLSLVGDSVKFRYEIKHASEIQSVVRRAKAIAETPPMGPVFVSFPMDIMDQECPDTLPTPDRINTTPVDEAAVREISEIINRSKNPCIVGGSEIDAFGAHSALVAFVDRIGCPLYAEPLSSRSPCDSSSSQYSGDLPPASTLINLKLLQNDLVLFVGGEITLYPYLPTPLLEGKEIVIVGMNPSRRIGKSYQMNPRMFLEAVLPLVEKKGKFLRPSPSPDRTRMLREKKRMSAFYVVGKAAAQFRDYVLFDESISSTLTVREAFGYRAGSYFTAKSGQLGWALPAGTGAAMRKDKVLVIIGDGSLMYSIQTLWTAARYSIPVKILVLNNGSYNILRSYAKSFYPRVEDREFLKFDLPLKGVAEGFGIETRIAGAELEELKWLEEGRIPKVLIANVDREVPKLFL